MKNFLEKDTTLSQIQTTKESIKALNTEIEQLKTELLPLGGWILLFPLFPPLSPL